MSDFTKQKSLWGPKAYISPNDMLVSRNVVGTGGEGKPRIVMPGSHDTVALFDDFLGDTGAFDWTTVNGDTGVAGVGSVAKVTGAGGVLRITTSADAILTPTAVIGFSQGLQKQWKANQGYLRMSARVKIGTLAGSEVYIGFSDSGGAEQGAYDTGGGIITNMADGIGFVYGGNSGTTVWRGIAARSVAADSGDQTATLTSSPTANVYQTLEVALDGDSGQLFADFYINGVKEGRISQPVNAVVALTPVVHMFASDAAALTLDVDYINVSAARDTGL
jgi:hypothetical protein